MNIIIGVLIIVLLLNIILISIFMKSISDYEEMMEEYEKKRNEQTEDGRFEDNK